MRVLLSADDLNKITMRKIIYILAFSMIQIGAFAQILSLDSCKSLAIENNKKLKEAHLEREAAEQVKKEAFTHYFPKIDAAGAAMKSSKAFLEVEIPPMNLPVYNGNPATLPIATEFAYFPGMSMELLDYTNLASITAIQPIFAGGRIYYGNQLASLGMEVSDLNILLSKDEIILNTEYYFWTIMSLKEKKNTINSYKEMLEQLYKEAEIAQNAGLVHQSDLLKINLEMNKLQAKELHLDNALVMLHMTLSQHIGLAYSDTLEFQTDELLPMAANDMLPTTASMVENRTEYKMLNKALEAEILRKRIARGDHLPQVAIGVQGLYLDVLENQNTYGLAFATVTIPISSWWGGTHELKEHQINIEKAQNKLEESTELMNLQIEKAYKDLNEGHQQVEIAQMAVNQAEEHFKVIQDHYDAGMVNTSDLLEARALLQEASDGLWDAKATFKIKQASYLQSIAQLK